MVGSSTCVIFDLDGTILDSKQIILLCLCKTLATYQIKVSPPLDRFIGPTVEELVTEILPEGSKNDREAFARDFVACYEKDGWNESPIFPGVSELLNRLVRAAVPLFICTSKRYDIALRILNIHHLTSEFRAVYGDQIERKLHTKTALLATLLKEQNIPAESAWFIGDRDFDINAAHANGVKCLAAGWGYGTSNEYRAADAFAASPADVFDIVHK
jgi:phosphoglycolate phosphatase